VKVLYDYAAFTMQARGGVSRVMYELIKHGVNDSRVDCRVFCGFHKNLYLHQAEENIRNACTGKYVPSSIAKQRWMNPVNKLGFRGYSHNFNPDICHYTFFENLPVPQRSKVVVTVHDLITDLFPGILGPKDEQSVKRRKVLDRADGIICVSENTRLDLLRHYDVDSGKVIVVHNGNDLGQQEVTTFVHVAPYVLYVGGRKTKYKNFDFVMRMLSSFSELEALHLICFGGGAFNISEEKRIEELGLKGRVVQMGGDDSVLAGCYKSAFAFVYPSTYEGFGIPPVEAMSLGCPVVVSNAPPMPEVVGKAGLYFDPAEEAHCARQISTLFNQETRDKLIQEGYKQSELYSWNKMGSEVYRFYERIIKDL